MDKYILAIDQGTTSTRSIIFDKKGQIVSTSQKELTMIYDQPGHVEQDANEIWLSVLTTMAEAMIKANIEASQIASIGITNQRETTVLWNKKTGKPVYKAIVWQSRQSEAICEKLRKQNLYPLVHEKTGLLIDPYFSGTKIMWALAHVDGLQTLMDEKDLAFGTIDSWILYKLSGHHEHKTDHTNASRTLLYNIKELKWDHELLEKFGIDSSILPSVQESGSHFGTTSPDFFFGEEVPITGILGDQQAALFGQCCYSEGAIKNTYGTGCFMLMNTGESPVSSDKGLLTTIGYSYNNKVTYALEGSVFVAGSAIQWLRDELAFFKNAPESETLATSVESNAGVVVVPAFVGLGTPYWDAEARGAIFGLTRGTTKAHITRATLDSLAYQSKDIIDVMKEESAISPTFIKVDGGAALNNYLMQFQADILDIDVIRPLISESTALGAAFISGLTSGYYKDLDELSNLNGVDITFTPSMAKNQKEQLLQKWKTAVKATQSFK